MVEKKIRAIKKRTGLHCASSICEHDKRKKGFPEYICKEWKCTKLQRRFKAGNKPKD